MSGGHYEYACFRVDDFIEEFEKNTKDDPLRIAFLAHLHKVRKAMHDIEWVDSCDYGPGDEHEAIKACLELTSLEETLKSTLRDRLTALVEMLG